MLEHLPDHISAQEPEPFAGPDHPIRVLTRAVASGKDWTSAHAERMTNLFDGLAPEWSARVDETKLAPIEDALDRGGAPLDGRWLEIGTGTGAGARTVGGRGCSIIATDISAEMLRHASLGSAHALRSDAAALPVRDRGVDAVLLVNMLLFPREVDRVLEQEGSIIWINTHGDQTPIHLPAADVLDALPGVWQGVTARAGTGFWMVARRDAARDRGSTNGRES
ncbi:MAG: methyltransferase domain-containing protein [Acidimicrobiia bacterium]|nr:methyltransferase domain-containing protein [Acidimicrobiia bacterium]